MALRVRPPFSITEEIKLCHPLDSAVPPEDQMHVWEHGVLPSGEIPEGATVFTVRALSSAERLTVARWEAECNNPRGKVLYDQYSKQRERILRESRAATAALREEMQNAEVEAESYSEASDTMYSQGEDFQSKGDSEKARECFEESLRLRSLSNEALDRGNKAFLKAQKWSPNGDYIDFSDAEIEAIQRNMKAVTDLHCKIAHLATIQVSEFDQSFTLQEYMDQPGLSADEVNNVYFFLAKMIDQLSNDKLDQKKRP